MVRRIFKRLNHGYQAKKAVLEAVGINRRKETPTTKKLRTRGKVDDTFGEFGTMTFGRTKPFIGTIKQSGWGTARGLVMQSY